MELPRLDGCVRNPSRLRRAGFPRMSRSGRISAGPAAGTAGGARFRWRGTPRSTIRSGCFLRSSRSGCPLPCHLLLQRGGSWRPGTRRSLSRLRRFGRAASVALRTALRRGLVPEMLGLLVIGLLAGNLADRERAPAASLSSPLIQSAGTGTLSAAVASPVPGNMPPAPARAQPSIHVAAHVTPLAAAAPRPSEPRPQNAESLDFAVTASRVSRPRPQASAAIATNGTSARPTAPPPGPRFRGHLVIESVPEGARVFVNQQAVGSTPIELPNLPAGSRAVRVEADGYELWSASVRVVAQQRTRVKANLQPSRN